MLIGNGHPKTLFCCFMSAARISHSWLVREVFFLSCVLTAHVRRLCFTAFSEKQRLFHIPLHFQICLNQVHRAIHTGGRGIDHQSLVSLISPDFIGIVLIIIPADFLRFLNQLSGLLSVLQGIQLHDPINFILHIRIDEHIHHIVLIGQNHIRTPSHHHAGFLSCLVQNQISLHVEQALAQSIRIKIIRDKGFPERAGRLLIIFHQFFHTDAAFS